MSTTKETAAEREARIEREQLESTNLRHLQSAKAKGLHLTKLAKKHPAVRVLISESAAKDRQIAELQEKLKAAEEGKSRRN